MFFLFSLKEQLIQSVYASSKKTETTNEHYEKYINKLEKVRKADRENIFGIFTNFLGNGKSPKRISRTSENDATINEPNGERKIQIGKVNKENFQFCCRREVFSFQ